MEYSLSKGPPPPPATSTSTSKEGKENENDVIIDVKATGSVTSAFSLHVVYEEYYLKKDNHDVDLFLVDHAANDMSLRKRL